MKENKNSETIKEVSIIKIILYSIFLLVLLALLILVPKKIFEDNLSFNIATSMVITDESNLLLYDYDVYATEARFNQGLIDDVDLVKSDFKSRSEILVVKIYGEEESIEIKDDYVFIVSPNTPELNIEYYLAKDMSFNNITFSCRTFIKLFDDISNLVNTIYIGVLTIFFGLTIVPVTVSLTKNIVAVRKKAKEL